MTTQNASARPVGRKRRAAAAPKVSPHEYLALARFRHTVREVLAMSEQACVSRGLTTQRFQALLALKAASPDGPMSVGDLADILFLRHHSAVELVNRLEAAGLIAREPDADDGRRVLLSMTDLGAAALAELALVHLDHLAASKRAFLELFDALPVSES